MAKEGLSILAVNDPAVIGYVELGIIEDYMTRFEKEINFEIIDFKDYGNKYQNVLAGVEKYDIFMVAGHLWLPELLEKEAILPLKVKTDDMFQVVADEITSNKEIYLAPSFCDGHLFIYRKSDFDKLGLSLPGEVVKTEEILEWAKKMSDTEKSPIAMKAHPSELFLDVLPFVRSHGCEPLTREGEVISNLGLLNKGIESYKVLLNLGDSKARNYGNQEIQKVIQENSVSMAITWNGQLGQIVNETCLDKEDLRFSNLENSWNVTWGFSIHKDTQQEELAQHFLNYLLTFEQANKIGKYSGAPIYKNSVLENRETFPWYDAHAELMKHAILLPHSSQTNRSMGKVVDYYLSQLDL